MFNQSTDSNRALHSRPLEIKKAELNDQIGIRGFLELLGINKSEMFAKKLGFPDFPNLREHCYFTFEKQPDRDSATAGPSPYDVRQAIFCLGRLLQNKEQGDLCEINLLNTYLPNVELAAQLDLAPLIDLVLKENPAVFSVMKLAGGSAKLPNGWIEIAPSSVYHTSVINLLAAITKEDRNLTTALSRPLFGSANEKEPEFTIQQYQSINLDAIETIFHRTSRGLLCGRDYDLRGNNKLMPVYLENGNGLTKLVATYQQRPKAKSRPRTKGKRKARPSPSSLAAEYREISSSICAYAILDGPRVIELRGDSESATEALLARICRDLIDEGKHEIQFHSSIGDPIGQYFRQIECHSILDPVLFKVQDLRALLEGLKPVIDDKLKQAGVKPIRPIRLESQEDNFSLIVSYNPDKGLEVMETGRAKRTLSAKNQSILGAMILGQINLSLSQHFEKLGITPSSIEVTKDLSRLFPRQELHFSQLELAPMPIGLR